MEYLNLIDLAPHLTHCSLVGLTTTDLNYEELEKFKYILFNLRHPGWGSSPEIAHSIYDKLNQTSKFELQFERDDVFLFT